jgi:hypothetical protein
MAHAEQCRLGPRLGVAPFPPSPVVLVVLMVLPSSGASGVDGAAF